MVNLTVEALQLLLGGLIGQLLEGFIAFCVFVVIISFGIFIANILGYVLQRFFKEAKIEKHLESHGVHDAFVGFTFTNIAVTLLKIYVAVIFLGIAADVVRIPILYMVASAAASYMPALVQGIIILLAGLIVADYLTDRMKVSKNIPFANTLAILVEVFIVYNVLVIAMPMLLPAVDPSLLAWSFLVLLTALCLSVGLGIAIAMGLGLKDTVSSIAKRHSKKFERLL
jgi:hypothetical protein